MKRNKKPAMVFKANGDVVLVNIKPENIRVINLEPGQKSFSFEYETA